MAGTRRTYAPWLGRLWAAAAVAGAAYGVFLVVTALTSPAGAELTGRFPGQPVAKALMALLLAAASLFFRGSYPIYRERRWLLGALLFSAVGDFLLAMPWWEPSFVGGLGAFLIAHLCYLAALFPLAAPSPPRLAAAAVTVVACLALLVWFWPSLTNAGLTIPVTVYMLVLGAMVCAALLAGLPTMWTAAGAVCFALSDGMIGIGRFVLAPTNAEALAVSIWWAYAISQILITAGFFFGRSGVTSDQHATPAQ
ncbi:lysoplasmalogenase [Mycolicibacterium komossense]|nr:lysoplasmalogenase [Mycolicibacterium komossense]